jgi:hypothetical protein
MAWTFAMALVDWRPVERLITGVSLPGQGVISKTSNGLKDEPQRS